MASVILGIALIVCTVLAGRTVVKVKGFGQQITVTGAAYKPITSDYSIWEGTINAGAPTLEPAYREIARDLKTVESFLQDQGFTPEQYEIGTIQISKEYNRDRVLTGYTLRQTVTIELPDIARITKLAKQASALIERGVEFESRKPRYLYTELDALKLEMIKAATENAKLRAQQLAETTDREVGAPVSARVGVFQIRPRHSQEVSGMGLSDVWSIEKEIVSTVHVSFLIE
jgi:hypothetical protein